VSRGLRTLRVLARGYGESRPCRADWSRPYRAPFVLFVSRGLRTLRVLARGYGESRLCRAISSALWCVFIIKNNIY
ncbi:MAG: hypothetical protein IKN52_11030, partial [Victivallales bacterium]|nr:hypothetical protein [Victivallales bacterium]